MSSRNNFISVSFILLYALMTSSHADDRLRRDAAHSDYGVVIDAGSSGTRVWVYSWPGITDNRKLPEIRALETRKLDSGVSHHESNNTAIGYILSTLIKTAADKVPQSAHERTPIYFFATAGLRLLSENRSLEVIQFIIQTLHNKSINPFRLVQPDFHVKILSGEEEGVFAWIALNYLTGAFELGPEDAVARSGQKRSYRTVGILELGGASTQIAFIPEGNPLANKFPVRIAFRRYPLYVHSYLRYGQDHVSLSIKEYLNNKTENFTHVENPCVLDGDSELHGGVIHHGTGNPEACIQLLKRVVYKDPDCHPKPCGIGSKYQPTLPFNKHFYVLGAFIHALKTFKAIAVDGSFVLRDVKTKAEVFCKMKYSDLLVQYNTTSPQFLSRTCLTGLYINVLFTLGYGLRSNSILYAMDKVGDKDVDWTLGALLYEREHEFFDDPCALASRSSAVGIYQGIPRISGFPGIAGILPLLVTGLISVTQLLELVNFNFVSSNFRSKIF